MLHKGKMKISSPILLLSMVCSLAPMQVKSGALDDFIESIDELSATDPAINAYMNGAENLPYQEREVFQNATVNGSILNATRTQLGSLQDFVGQSSVGSIGTSVIGAANQGGISVNAVTTPVLQSPLTASATSLPPVFASNFSSNQMILSGSITGDISDITGSAGRVSTSVTGALNTGNIAIGLRTISDNILNIANEGGVQ